jgi:autotransporter-associated beta strand protein
VFAISASINQVGASGGSWGLHIVLTANQTNSVNISTPLSVSDGLRLADISIAAGAGPFSLGDSTLHALDLLMGGIFSQTHTFVNNSANPATINPNVRWRLAGGGVHHFVFDGSGDWVVSNYLLNASSSLITITKQGPGTMTWTGGTVPNAQANGFIQGPVVIDGGALILRSPDLLTNMLAPQNITNNGTRLEYAASGSETLPGVISGSGALLVSSGTLTLSGTNTYVGPNTVSGGTLFINGSNAASSTVVYGGVLGGAGTLSGAVTLSAGTILAPGASAGSIGTLTINNDLSIGGDLTFEVNKSLSPSNDLVIVSGVLTNTGAGTLTISNLGPAIAPGDKFVLFSEPLQNGGALTVTCAGVTWTNNLSVDGSITVIPVEPPELSFVRIGNNLQFSWNSILGTYKLQAQTNDLEVGLATNWSDYPGGATNPVTVPIDSSTATLFFRLVSTGGP